MVDAQILNSLFINFEDMKGYEYIKLLRKNLTLFGLENNYPQNAKPFFFHFRFISMSAPKG